MTKSWVFAVRRNSDSKLFKVYSYKDNTTDEQRQSDINNRIRNDFPELDPEYQVRYEILDVDNITELYNAIQSLTPIN